MGTIEAMKKARDALNEAMTYTSCATFSPSMTREVDEAAKALDACIAREEAQSELSPDLLEHFSEKHLNIYANKHPALLVRQLAQLVIKQQAEAQSVETTHGIAHSCAGFFGGFISEHGRNPTHQEIWNHAIRSWRDLNPAPAPTGERAAIASTKDIRFGGRCDKHPLQIKPCQKCVDAGAFEAKGICPECEGEGEQGGQFCGGYWTCEKCGGTGAFVAQIGKPLSGATRSKTIDRSKWIEDLAMKRVFQD